jgi:hypothetical protein
MRNTLILATGILLASGLAWADQSFESFDSADTNSDGNISKDEFYGLVSDAGIYPDWDYDSDGFIDENEYNDLGLTEDFDGLDANNDSYLDADEFYEGYFSAFDGNEDGHWSGYEWDDAGDGGLFDV